MDVAATQLVNTQGGYDLRREGRTLSTAEMIGIHPPSDTTCHMVRALMRYSR